MIYKFNEQAKDGKIPCIITGRLRRMKGFPLLNMETRAYNDKKMNVITFYVGYDFEQYKDVSDPDKIQYKQISQRCEYNLNGYRKNLFNFVEKLKEYTEIIVFGYLIDTYRISSSGEKIPNQTLRIDTLIPIDGIVEKLTGKINNSEFHDAIRSKTIEKENNLALLNYDKYKF